LEISFSFKLQAAELGKAGHLKPPIRDTPVPPPAALARREIWQFRVVKRVREDREGPDQLRTGGRAPQKARRISFTRETMTPCPKGGAIHEIAKGKPTQKGRQVNCGKGGLTTSYSSRGPLCDAVGENSKNVIEQIRVVLPSLQVTIWQANAGTRILATSKRERDYEPGSLKTER